MEQWVRDDVWSRLDPRAGALDRRQRNRLIAGVAAAVVALTAGFVIDRAGVVHARLERAADSADQASVATGSKTITHTVAVRNTGWTTVHITGIGQDGPGLRLLTATDPGGPTRFSDIPGTPPPFDLDPGQVATMVVAYRVTDCAAVPSDRFPIPIRADGLWGTQTTDLYLPPSYVGPAGIAINPPLTEWQKAMADQACGVRRP